MEVSLCARRIAGHFLAERDSLSARGAEQRVDMSWLIHAGLAKMTHLLVFKVKTRTFLELSHGISSFGARIVVQGSRGV